MENTFDNIQRHCGSDGRTMGESMKSINQDFEPPFLFLITTALLSAACFWLSSEIIFQLITKG
jgi:hypothetical protein